MSYKGGKVAPPPTYICPQCGADGCQCPPATERMAPQSDSRWLTDFSLPDGIIVGEYTGEMQRAYAQRGITLLSVDYGPSDDPGVWHFQGDARVVAYSRRWPLLIAHPTCKHVARSGQQVWPKKIADGSHWWGLANILLWLCAPALAVLIEQPIGAFEKYYDAPMQTLQPWQHGHGNSKTWRLFHSDNVPVILPTRIVGSGTRRAATSEIAAARKRAWRPQSRRRSTRGSCHRGARRRRSTRSRCSDSEPPTQQPAIRCRPAGATHSRSTRRKRRRRKRRATKQRRHAWRGTAGRSTFRQRRGQRGSASSPGARKTSRARAPPKQATIM